ncbi:FAD-dependent monooxygenase [Pseudooceanicola sp. C21-150M6]|uniref:FAD-dependent monooxygenase n=1 Tax=Pseudooceanicola sp. C21-150M6 TaxID=3434355 RepID=UPI003D7F3205
MQFHLNGFRPGDPRISPAATKTAETGEVDVLIIGCGPAGLTLAAQLSAFPDIHTRITDQKDGPLELGQADGIACRTMEMFNAFGFARAIEEEACWISETTFWAPSDDPAQIHRTGRVQDVEDDLSEFPHVILNQARVHDRYLEVMARSPRRLVPDYGWQLRALDVTAGQPVTAHFDTPDGPQTLRARYVIGCDGARSTVRREIGLNLTGDSANQAWGVMDVLADTDFPDIRFKAVIRSAAHGNVLNIPREGGYLTRLYIELDKLAPGERLNRDQIGPDRLVAAAQRILAPYTFDAKEIAWWSVYEIGQRLCDRFEDDTGHVLIAGDACHTHSPKAGQGMNVSMGDAFNLGWKLAAVLRGQASADLLKTYTAERQGVAADLIAFDREFARRFSEQGKATGGAGEALDPEEFRAFFQKQGRYTAGTAVHYAPSLITAGAEHQALATGQTVGMRFHSAPVIRVSDAKPLHLGHVAEADGRWRLYAFAGAEGGSEGTALWQLCEALASDDALPFRRYTPAGADPDAIFDLRAIVPQPLHAVELAEFHPLLRPRKGRYHLPDPEKIFCADPKADIYEMRGIDRHKGALIVTRPDQYISAVLPLTAPAELSEFFDKFMRAAEEPRGGTQ